MEPRCVSHRSCEHASRSDHSCGGAVDSHNPELVRAIRARAASAANAARMRVSSKLGRDAFVLRRRLDVSVVPEIGGDPIRRGYRTSQHRWRDL
jgi:hypothetical protein